MTAPPSCEVCGAKTRPNGELPSDHYADRRRETPELRRKAHLAVHRPSACSGVKALRNTSDATRQAAKLCYRFGPLTPSARSANLIPGDGTKNGRSRSEQKTVSTTQNNRLTGKAPYSVSCEPASLASRCVPDAQPCALISAISGFGCGSNWRRQARNRLPPAGGKQERRRLQTKTSSISNRIDDDAGTLAE